jgi:hypothetical protein
MSLCLVRTEPPAWLHCVLRQSRGRHPKPQSLCQPLLSLLHNLAQLVKSPVSDHHALSPRSPFQRSSSPAHRKTPRLKQPLEVQTAFLNGPSQAFHHDAVYSSRCGTSVPQSLSAAPYDVPIVVKQNGFPMNDTNGLRKVHRMQSSVPARGILLLILLLRLHHLLTIRVAHDSSMPHARRPTSSVVIQIIEPWMSECFLCGYSVLGP